MSKCYLFWSFRYCLQAETSPGGIFTVWDATELDRDSSEVQRLGLWQPCFQSLVMFLRMQYMLLMVFFFSRGGRSLRLFNTPSCRVGEQTAGSQCLHRTRNAVLENRGMHEALNKAEEITSGFSALTHRPWDGEDGKSLLWVATEWNISEHLSLTGLKKQRKGSCWLWKSWMNVLRAVILVALVIKLNGGLMGNVHFPRICWVKCRFLEILSGAGQRWQRTQSQNKDEGMREGGRQKKDILRKCRGDNI